MTRSSIFVRDERNKITKWPQTIELNIGKRREGNWLIEWMNKTQVQHNIQFLIFAFKRMHRTHTHTHTLKKRTKYEQWRAIFARAHNVSLSLESNDWKLKQNISTALCRTGNNNNNSTSKTHCCCCCNSRRRATRLNRRHEEEVSSLMRHANIAKTATSLHYQG